MPTLFDTLVKAIAEAGIANVVHIHDLHSEAERAT